MTGTSIAEDGVSRRDFMVAAGAAAVVGGAIGTTGTPAAAAVSANEICRMDAVTLAEKIRTKQLSPTEVTEAVLARMDKLNPVIGAFCTPSPDVARAQAKAVESRHHGRERQWVRSPACRSASRIWSTPKASRPRRDRSSTRTSCRRKTMSWSSACKAAGAVIIGKTNVPELGYSGASYNLIFPPTNNPWNTERTAGRIERGLGCGGRSRHRPDGDRQRRRRIGPHSRLDQRPVRPEGVDGPRAALSRDQGRDRARSLGMGIDRAHRPDHPHGRRWRADDERDRVGSRRPRPPQPSPTTSSGWRRSRATSRACALLGRPTGAMRRSIPKSAKVCAKAAKVFADQLGCKVEEASPWKDDYFGHFFTIVLAETDLKGMRALVAKYGDHMQPHLVDAIKGTMTDEQITDAVMARKKCANQAWRFFRTYDLLLTPTIACPPFKHGHPGSGNDRRQEGRPVPMDHLHLSVQHDRTTRGHGSGRVYQGRAADRTADRRPAPRRRFRAAGSGRLRSCRAVERQVAANAGADGPVALSTDHPHGALIFEAMPRATAGRRAGRLGRVSGGERLMA